MKNKDLVEPLLLVAVRLGTGATTEMQLMIDLLRLVADRLERCELERAADATEAPP